MPLLLLCLAEEIGIEPNSFTYVRLSKPPDDHRHLSSMEPLLRIELRALVYKTRALPLSERGVAGMVGLEPTYHKLTVCCFANQPHATVFIYKTILPCSGGSVQRRKRDLNSQDLSVAAFQEQSSRQSGLFLH